MNKEINIRASIRQLLKRIFTFYKYRSFKDFSRGWKRYNFCLGVFEFNEEGELIRIGDCDSYSK